jgi:segregation and condensation protein B
MESKQNPESQIESILFVASKPLSAAAIAKILTCGEADVDTALRALRDERRNSGLTLSESDGTWQLTTNPQNAECVKNFLNAELRERLTDVTVETLAIIAYRQPISRAEVEAIRGVNCQYSIRTLLIRGLIAKLADPNDGRQLLYQTTHEFLRHMGLQSVRDLPDFETLVEKIKLPVDEKLSTVEPTSPEQSEPQHQQPSEN